MNLSGSAKKQIMDLLVRTAKSRDLITYGKVAPLVDMDMSNPVDRDRLANLLGGFCIEEHKQVRSLISIIVVRNDSRRPGKGFFKLANWLGVHFTKDSELIFVRETARVYEYWARENSYVYGDDPDSIESLRRKYGRYKDWIMSDDFAIAATRNFTRPNPMPFPVMSNRRHQAFDRKPRSAMCLMCRIDKLQTRSPDRSCLF